MQSNHQVSLLKKSFLGRVRELPRHSFSLRLIIWALFLIILNAVIAFHPSNLASANFAMQGISAVTLATSAIALLVYALIKFGEKYEMRWLATAISSAAMAISGELAIERVFFHATVSCNTLSIIFAAISILSLAYAGISRRQLSRSELQLALGIFLALTIAGIIYRQLIYLLIAAAGYISPAGAIALLASISVACILAVVYHGQRYIADNDRLGGLLAYVCTTGSVAVTFAWLEILFPMHISWHSEALITTAALILVIGLGIENGVAQRESNERLEELECLHAISWSLIGTETLNSLLSTFAEALCQKLEGTFVSVYLVDEDTPTVTNHAVHGLDSPERWLGKSYSLTPQQRPGFHSGHTARALALKDIQVVSDVYADVEFIPWQEVGKHDGYVVSIPLLEGSKTVGVTNIFFDSIKPLTENRLRLFKTIATSVVPAIKNAYMAERDTFNLIQSRAA